MVMHDNRRELYRSANGDVWWLCRDESGAPCVEHVPNAPSGGKRSRVGIATFLARGAQGPEHQALFDLIGGLIDEAPPRGNASLIA
jgi:hypothetical protein